MTVNIFQKFAQATKTSWPGIHTSFAILRSKQNYDLYIISWRQQPMILKIQNFICSYLTIAQCDKIQIVNLPTLKCQVPCSFNSFSLEICNNLLATLTNFSKLKYLNEFERKWKLRERVFQNSLNFCETLMRNKVMKHWGLLLLLQQHLFLEIFAYKY